jgi:hypothetical protein
MSQSRNDRAASNWNFLLQNVRVPLLRRQSSTGSLRSRTAPSTTTPTTTAPTNTNQTAPQHRQRLQRRLTSVSTSAQRRWGEVRNIVRRRKEETDKAKTDKAKTTEKKEVESKEESKVEVDSISKNLDEDDEEDESVLETHAMMEYDYDDVDDDEIGDQGLSTLSKVAAFQLFDGTCSTVIQCLQHFPSVTLTRTGVLSSWSKNVYGHYKFDASSWKWFYHSVRELGLTGLYAGIKWNIYEAVTCMTVDWFIAWLPTMLNLRDRNNNPYQWSMLKRRVLSSVITVIPQIYFQWRYFTETTALSDADADADADTDTSVDSNFFALSTLSAMFKVVPWWMIGRQLCLNFFVDKKKTTEYNCDVRAIKYFLPKSHPLRETRSLLTCINETSSLNLILSWTTDILPSPNYEWSTAWSYAFKCRTFDSWIGYFIGRSCTYPISMVYTWGINNVLEDTEHRLARKLQMAADKETHGFISMFSNNDNEENEKSVENDSKQTSRLLRTSTILLKRNAVTSGGHAAKHQALMTRQIAHANLCRRNRLSNAQMKQKLFVSRKNMESSLSSLAHCSILPLKYGNIRIEYEGEEGLDAGGLLRDWIETVAHGLSESSAEEENTENLQHRVMLDNTTNSTSHSNCIKLSELMKPGADSGLLPVPFESLTCSNEKNLHHWREQMFGIGRLMGLAVTTGTPLPIQMSRTLYKVILGEAITTYDLKRIDPNFYKNRVQVILEEGGVKKMESILYDELYFVSMPRNREEAEEGTSEELLPGGKTLRVTEKNKKRYLRLFIEHYLIGHTREGVSLIVEGFKDIVPKSVLRRSPTKDFQKLSALDLELIVSGIPNINIDDWKSHTYGNITSMENAQLFGWFWEIVEEMNIEQRTKLLSYCCGSSRLPASGFSGLSPRPFNISVTGESIDNLPTAHTCFNQLQLPKYTSKDTMKEKLNRAILECEGFGFL